MGPKEFILRAAGRASHEMQKCVSRLFKARCRVYMLHQVGGDVQSEFNVSADAFRALARHLASAEVARSEDTPFCIPGSVILTFDDVHDGVYNIAYPILTEYQIPFTLFISLSLLDTPGYLTSEQLKEMATDPLVTIGSHGVDHIFYRDLDDAAFRRQLLESSRRLKKITGLTPEVFAFPYGSEYQCGFFGKQRVSDYYRYGFGTIPMPVTRMSNSYFYPRINLTEELIEKITDTK